MVLEGEELFQVLYRAAFENSGVLVNVVLRRVPPLQQRRAQALVPVVLVHDGGWLAAFAKHCEPTVVGPELDVPRGECLPVGEELRAHVAHGTAAVGDDLEARRTPGGGRGLSRDVVQHTLVVDHRALEQVRQPPHDADDAQHRVPRAEDDARVHDGPPTRLLLEEFAEGPDVLHVEGALQDGPRGMLLENPGLMAAAQRCCRLKGVRLEENVGAVHQHQEARPRLLLLGQC
mmetsp:Transcript_32712/g.102436  ORF Transcript_32712/g.102436 Transcript_32712/m.102436 type:complete len:232 (+) Transcript_32712:193-888(+)